MQIPDKILSYSWAKNKGLCIAIKLISMANWPKNKTCKTSVLQLAGELGWSWRTVDKELKTLADSGFIKIKPVQEKSIKKLEIKISEAPRP